MLRFAPIFAALALAGLSTASHAEALAPSAEFRLSPLSDQQQVLLPSPDLEKIRLEDQKSVGGAYRYGVSVDLSKGPISVQDKNAGTWTTLRDGRLVWRLPVTSPGARSLDFGFSKFKLPSDAALYVVGAGGKLVRGPYGPQHNQDSGQLWTAFVPGESATLELIVPRHQVAEVQLELGTVNHGYRGLFEDAEAEKSGSCNVDVACPAGNGWQDQIDSVGHYTFSRSGSSYVCTGTLIANTAQNLTPYFLTANHCVNTATVVNTMVVYWNYQSSTCRTPGSSASGTPLSRTIATHNQSGASLISTNAASDFALVRLSSNVPSGANPYWSGWDASNVAPSSAVGIHHPSGHEKRIAVENNPLSISAYSGNAGSGTTHLRVAAWDQGTTEGGSSGSGLWNSSKRLVGQLHGGSAACGNNLPDWYGRIATSWTGGGTAATRLRDWLNPAGGVTSMDGYRTAGGGTTPPATNVLQRGVTVTGLSASTGVELSYTMVVPSGASNLRFQISGGTGDADLYVRFGSAPTTSTYDCRPYLGGNAETCTFATPQAGTYHVKVRAYAAFSGVSLVGNYDTSSGGGTQPSFFQNTTRFNINDNSTIESPIAVSGRTGNAPSTLKVDLTIYHTYRGDLQVYLIAPNGTSFTLHNRTGGSAQNLIGSYTVNASAIAANGTWRLRVRDRANGDVGYLDKWSLQF